MIIVSAALAVIATAFLVSGVAMGSGQYLFASIVASALAALALIVGVRRLATGPLPGDDYDVPGPPPRERGVNVTHLR